MRYTIHTTRNCNLNCEYCYENITGLDVKWEIIKENIDLILNENTSNNIKIEFLGGEPMLAFDLIEKACNYFENNKYDNNISYMLTTNGTILTEKMLNIIKKFNIYIYVSIDGLPFTHNMKRVFKNTNEPTYDIIAKNVKKMLNCIPNLVGVQFTTHKSNIEYLYDGIKSLYDLGIRKINIGYVTPDVNEKFVDVYLSEHQKVLNNLNYFDGLNLQPMMGSTILLKQQTKINGEFLDDYSFINYDINELELYQIMKLKVIELYKQ